MLLNEMQALFKETMLDHPQILENPDARLAALFEEGDIPLPERLKVYRNNVVGSLTEIMAASFPIVLKLVGRDFFDDMARAFILAHPPASGCLSHYGAGFDDFIKSYAPAKDLAYLPDVARLEIAMNEAYFARDDHPLTAEALGGVAAEELPDIRLEPRASVIVMRSKYPLTAIRDFCLNGAEGILDIDRPGETIMIHRPRLAVEIEILAADEVLMLETLQEKTLGEALETVMEAYPTFDFQEFLKKNLGRETFLALSTNTREMRINA